MSPPMSPSAHSNISLFSVYPLPPRPMLANCISSPLPTMCQCQLMVYIVVPPSLFFCLPSPNPTSRCLELVSFPPLPLSLFTISAAPIPMSRCLELVSSPCSLPPLPINVCRWTLDNAHGGEQSHSHCPGWYVSKSSVLVFP